MNQGEETGVLHQEALEAWRKGETTAALSKIERLLAQEMASADHDLEAVESLRNLYEEVQADEGAIKSAHERASTLLDEGNIEQALAICENQLERFPGHPLFEALKLDAAEQRQKQVATVVSEVEKKLENEADLDRGIKIIEDALQQCPGEPQLESALSISKQRRDIVASLAADAESLEQKGNHSAALDRWLTIRNIYAAHPKLEAESSRLKKLSETTVAPPTSQPAPQTKSAQKPPSKGRRIQIAVVVVAAFAGLALTALIFHFWSPVGEVAVFPVAIRTSPPGATITIDSNYRGISDLDMELPAGTYAVEATLNGYVTYAGELTVDPEHPAALDLTLTPLPASVHIVSDLVRATTTLDGEPVETPEENEIVLQDLSPGDHVLSVKGRYGHFTVPFTVVPGAAPALNGELKADEVIAVAVTQLGESASVYCNCGPARLMVDGAPAGTLAPEGLDLENLELGFHELTLGENRNARQVALDTTAAPALHLFLHSDRNVGTIAVMAGEIDGATVTLNGKPHRRTTKSGRVRLYALPVAKYRVSISKDGFQPVDEQTVQVSKGRVAAVRFRLEPIPVVEELPAELVISGALAGASVAIDGTVKGTIAYDGSFSTQLDPGRHTITLSRAAFRPRELEREFSAGHAVRLGIEDVALEQILGSLVLERMTADANVTVRRAAAGASDATPVNATIRLAPGAYVIAATAAGHEPMLKEINISPGETTRVPIQLTAEPTEVLGMELWEDSAGWSRQGVWYVRRGGNLVPYGASPVEGSIEFTARLDRGRRLRWFVNLISSKEYALFEIDAGSLYCNQVTTGKSKLRKKVPHPRVSGNVYKVRIRISADTVIHQLHQGDEWVTIDTWTQKDRDFRQGKFGFYIRGRSQMGLSGFAYRPN